MRYRITLSYDGSPFLGWQVQASTSNNKKSIQSHVQAALQTVLRHPINLTGSSRTDSGVHALGQMAHFDTKTPFDPKRLLLSLNALLPPEIRALAIDPVPDTFHARYSASGKIYHYRLHLDRILDPFKAKYSYHFLEKIDLSNLYAATQKCLGTHDFTSFASQPSKGSASRDPIRTLKRFDVVDELGGIRLELQADGFLYRMVRNLVGTVLEVARGKIEPSAIDAIFSARDRKAAGPSAPAYALFLVEVLYDKELESYAE